MLAGLRRIYDDLANVVPYVVTQGTVDDVLGLIDEERCRRVGCLFNLIVGLTEMVEIPLQFFERVSGRRGADNDTNILGELKFGKLFACNLAVVILHGFGHAASLGVFRQGEITPGKAELRGERGTFVASLLLLNLYDDFLAFAQGLLNRCATLAVTLSGVIAGPDFL